MIKLVIPALDPPREFIQLVETLVNDLKLDVVVVDDGSRSPVLFDQLRVNDRVTVLHHGANRGKGEALKTAFRHLLKDPTVTLICTLDSDGQHLPLDVARVCDAARRHPDRLILGARSFGNEVPLRSVVGNRMTGFLLRTLYGLRLTDSQTGLRAIPRELAELCLSIPSKRYGFELEMLLLAKDRRLEFDEVSIATVYLDNNRSSHFRPLRDSLGVYLVFLRFSLASLSSFAIDILLFTLLHFGTGSVFLSTYGARISSGAFNFLTNRNLVFRAAAGNTMLHHFFWYAVLAVGIATASAFLVERVSAVFSWMSPVAAKILIDPCLFVFSFASQRYAIFRDTRGADPK